MVNRSIIDGTLWTEVGAYLWEAKPQAPAVTNPQAPVQQQNTLPIAQAKATSTIKKSNVQSNNITGWVSNIPSITPQAPIVQQPLDTTDTSWKVNLKDNKWWLQQRAEKTGVVKDWQILDQTGLSNQAIARAWVLMKSKADAWEKIDEAVLQDIFDRQLKNVGIKAGTPQFAEAQKQMMSQFAAQQQKLGHATIQDAFNSINSKYNDLSKLKLQYTDDIMNKFSSLTAEQKNYLEQNNPNYALAKAKVDAKAKADQINNTINKTAVSTKEQIKEENSQFAKWDTLAELESQEMRDLFWEISQYDDEIVTIQDEIDPKKLEKRIASQFPTSLTSWALRALADNEFNVKSEKLDKLMKLRELAKDTYETRRAEIIQNDKLIKERDNTVMQSLLDNGWMGLMATSQKDIDQMVESGQLSKAGATLIKKQQQGMMSNTMQTLWFVTPQMQKSIDSMLARWMWPWQIMQSLINSWTYRPPMKQDWNTTKMDDWSLLMYDQSTWETKMIRWQQGINELWWWGSVEPVDPDKLLECISKAQEIGDTTSSNLNCATFLNKVGITPVWTTIQEKIKRITPWAWPIPWSVMVLSGMSQPTYWHVALVERVNPDGTIQIREANYNGKWGIRSTIVDPRNPWASRGVAAKIEWYQVPWWVKQWWQSNIQWLSQLALDAYKTKSFTGTEKQRSAIVEELSARWLLEDWSWNSAYYKIKPTEKTDIEKIKNWKIQRDRFMSIYNSLTEDEKDWFAWWRDSKKGSTQEKLWSWNPKYIEMNRILWTELSNYMKQISWATVADQEVERLKDQIPNRWQWNKKFKETVKSYNDAMEDTKYSIEKVYWLSWDRWSGKNNNQYNQAQPEVFQSTLRY